MKYLKPVVVNLNVCPAEGYCAAGTGASSSGCNAGPVATYTCAGGADPGAANSCYDGNSAYWCAAGPIPNGSVSRCDEGNGPS